MARDVNASINKCEKAIAQEEKNIVANTSRKNESELPNYYLKRITDYQNEIMKLLKDLLLAVTKAEHECAESEKSNGG